MEPLFRAESDADGADDGMGRTFVWAHDLAGSVAQETEQGLFNWTAATEVARVVRYDARGHGQATGAYHYRSYRWSALVDDMVRAAGQGPFVAGGTSMGCATSLFAALLAPRRVQALVLALPPAAWEARPAQAERYEAGARVVETRGLPAFVEVLRSQPDPAVLAGHGQLKEVSLRHVLTMDEKLVPAILRGAAASDLPSRDDIRTIVVPTLILAWDGDPAHPLSTAETLASLMLQSDLRVAHDLDDARTWPRVVRDFLAAL
ncbi:MAG: alpha/beta hydrolase [Actinomycetota bacterium]|nr:alpha/beta hydrolase [Actinomycetota bacterium]